MSDQNATPDNAALFREMADRIKLNEANGFGGAVVIVPPKGATGITSLMVEDGDPAFFWSTLKSRIDLMINQLAEQEARQNQPFGRR